MHTVDDSAALARRLLRDLSLATLVAALVTEVVWGWRVAGGVVAGGLMAAWVVWGAKRVVARIGADVGAVDEPRERPIEGANAPDAAVPDRPESGLPVEAPRRASPQRLMFGVAFRQVLLAAAAYGIIGRLRLHPLGVLVGVSTVVVAATAEAVRAWHRPHLP